MSTHIGYQVLVAAGVAVFSAACAHETDAGPNVAVATTTSAVVTKNDTMLRVSRARCKRAQECDRMGAGQMYESKDDCLDRERDAVSKLVTSCGDINRERLDKCIDMLENQHCDADLGPVTAMSGCHSYCAPMVQ